MPSVERDGGREEGKEWAWERERWREGDGEREREMGEGSREGKRIIFTIHQSI